MASVFLSYDRDDAETARPIAAALEKAGHSVWWDLQVRGGAQFAKVIEEALKAADVVVVLWSKNSVDSAWVRDEATAGRDSGRLVPATIDGTQAPLGFRQFQTIDLIDWKRGARGRGYKALEQAIGDNAQDRPAAAGNGAHASRADQRSPDTGAKRSTSRWVAGAAVAILLVSALAFAFWRFTGRASSVPIVAVAAADSSALDQALARDLLVKLGGLWAARTDAVKLTAEARGDGMRPNYSFQAAGTSLSLVGKDGTLLWSKDFDAQAQNRTVLEQSMAYNAGQVLDCVLQANGPKDRRLDEQTFKLFLNGCALFGERYWADVESVVPILSQVVAAAPDFQPAWAKLLLAEAQAARGQMVFFGRVAPGKLPEHVQAVRRLNPRMPELYIAEGALLPLGAVEQRWNLVDEAVRLNPDNPNLWITRSEILAWVGRMKDSVDAARRATELDPLSPGVRGVLIQTLAYAGQVPAAAQELRVAEQLWPGSPSIDDASFRFNSRFGDPREALRLLHSPDFHPPYRTDDLEAYLQARIEPSEANINRAIAAASSPELLIYRRVAQLAQLLADFGRNDQLYRLLMNLPADQNPATVLFRPAFRNFRQDPRFMQLAVGPGFLNFWRKSDKWPDFCSDADLPYDCRKEAAKILRSATRR